MPADGYSETMLTMKTIGANRCLLIATIALFPLAGIAQEQAPVAESPMQAPVPQTRYVSDKLVLNVYAEADQGSGRVATISTGDSVEELERSGNMVRVRLEDGREGWVGANYLTSDAPAAVRLRELQRAQKSAMPTRDPGKEKELADEIARLKKENSSLQVHVKELQANLMTPVPPAEDTAQLMPTSAVEIANDGSEHQASIAPNGGAWWAWLIALVVTGALGYASGYQALARRLRKKFGGLKIY